MKFILITLLSFLGALSAFAQIGEGGKTVDPEIVRVEQVFLAKDDGEGGAGEVAENFLTTDIPIYCVVELNSTKSTVVKMNLVAVSVAGVKGGSKIFTVSYKTNGRQNRVNFTGKPEGNWTAGAYRIDIFINDKLAAGKPFEISSSPSNLKKTPAQDVKSFAAPKSKPAPKIAKRTKKN